MQRRAANQEVSMEGAHLEPKLRITVSAPQGPADDNGKTRSGT